jgi:hypothetical protein
MDAYLDVLRQLEAEIGEHATWVDDPAGTVGQVLVPGLRDAQSASTKGRPNAMISLARSARL